MRDENHPEYRAYQITRKERCDDHLSGIGLYFRTRNKGGLIVFSRNGHAMGIYERGDWLSISDVTPDQPKEAGR